MGPSHINTRPYGEAPREISRLGISVLEVPGAGVARAREKLKAYLAGDIDSPPIGKAYRWASLPVAKGAALVAFSLATAFELKAFATFPFTLIGLWIIIYGLRGWWISGPVTPYRCIREYVHCIERGDFGRAHRLLSPLDLDASPRSAPSAAGHRVNPNHLYPFIDKRDFARYWKSAKALALSKRLKLKVPSQPQRMTDDIYLAPVQLNFLKTLGTVQGSDGRPLRTIAFKLLLRYGDEWRVFNGEVAGEEEVSDEWIRDLLLPPQAGADHSAAHV